MTNMDDFAGRNVVVTGAAGGIGRAIVAEFADRGATVTGWDITADPTDRRDVRIAVDLADETSVSRAASSTLEAQGSIDVLVTAAGLLRAAPITEMALSDWEAMFSVNVTGAFLAIKHAVPAMPPGSSIVVIGSVTAFVGHRTTSAYGMTKGAVHSLARGLSMELAPRGIRVNTVCPSWVDTGFTHQVFAQADDAESMRKAADASHLLGRMCRPEEVAHVVAFLAGEQATFMTGGEVFVDGGFMVGR